MAIQLAIEALRAHPADPAACERAALHLVDGEARLRELIEAASAGTTCASGIYFTMPQSRRLAVAIAAAKPQA